MDSKNIKIRKAKDRGHGNYGWLNTYHTFSFGDYQDPQFMGYRSIRVINDDTVKPGHGFEPHRHQNMEIISFIIDGALEHKDNAGNGSVIKKGCFQRMTAGTGIKHSEYNPSQDRPVHFLQIWINPESIGLEPSYEELVVNGYKDGLTKVAAPTPEKGQMLIHQDINIYYGQLKEYQAISQPLQQGRGAWIQMIDGKLMLNEEAGLDQGDGAAIENESLIKITSLTDAAFLLFDSD